MSKIDFDVPHLCPHCIRVDPEQGVAGTMVFEMFKDSMDETYPNVLFWMDPRPPEGHTGNCND